MTGPRQSKWNVTSDIDFERFSSGDRLTYVEAVHDNSENEGGFKFFVRGLLDDQGRFHMIGHEVVVFDSPPAVEEYKSNDV
jgi:hypothetical protein